MDSSRYRVDDVMTRAVVAVGRNALFKDIVERMERWHVSALPVLEGDGRVAGVVSEADLLPKEEFWDNNPATFTRLHRGADLAKAGARTAERLMSAPAVTVRSGAPAAEATRIMAERHVKRLPVVDAGGVLVGVISRRDLLGVLPGLSSDEPESSHGRSPTPGAPWKEPCPPREVRGDTMYGSPRTVGDVMTCTVTAVGPHAPFKEIVRLMQDRRVSALPVIEGEGRVVGVVSEADLLPKEEVWDAPGPGGTELLGRRDAAKAEALTAAELMSSPAVTVHAEAPLAQAARTMAQNGVRRLPVVGDDGLLAGVVSRTDLLKVFLRSDADIAEEVRHEVVSHLFRPPASTVHVEVNDGVVTFVGQVRDTSLVPVAAGLARAVDGVVDVEFDLAPARTMG